jgi:hypothetical protein
MYPGESPCDVGRGSTIGGAAPGSTGGKLWPELGVDDIEGVGNTYKALSDPNGRRAIGGSTSPGSRQSKFFGSSGIRSLYMDFHTVLCNEIRGRKLSSVIVRQCDCLPQQSAARASK